MNDEEEPKSKRKQRIHVWLPVGTVVRLQQEALEREVPMCRIVEASLARRYEPLSDEDKDALLARRLNRIDIKLRALERQLEINAECLALYVRMWLSSAPEVPENQRDAAYMKGQARYDRYIKSVSKRLQLGQSVFTDLPREVVLREDEWAKE